MPFLLLSLQAQVNDCDKYAGNPYDKTLPIEGIEFENIDADKAIKACEDSVKNEPKNLRYLYQLGRAYYKKEEYSLCRQ